MVAPPRIQSAPAAVAVAPRPQAHFHFLDGLRGLASFWVVFYHFDLVQFPQLAEILPSFLTILLFEWGSLGVAIFFVLSGFVIAHSLREVTIDRPYLQNFSLRRWVRLSPPYYVSIGVSLLLALVAAWVKGQPLPWPSVPALLAHGLYLQDVLQLGHINEVYWTLCLEVQFYLVFCLLLEIAQRWAGDSSAQVSLGVFGGGGLLALICPLLIETSVRPTWFAFQGYSFLLGAFAYWVWIGRLSSGLFYGYGAVLLAGGMARGDRFAIAAGLTAFLLLQVAQYQRLGTWLSDPVTRFLGQISYSLYLIHVPLVGAVVFVSDKLLSASLGNDLATLAIALMVSLAGAWLLWWLAERPAMAWSRSLKRTTPQAPPSASPA